MSFKRILTNKVWMGNNTDCVSTDDKKRMKDDSLAYF